MSLKNRLFNWIHGIKRVNQKGCRNVGKMTRFNKGKQVITKYDWSKSIQYTTKPYYFNFNEFKGGMTHG